MKTRRLGAEGPELTRIGLGTWALGGPWAWGWGPQNDDDSIAAIHTALATGVNWIDTAPIYGFGHAEEIIGTALSGYPREKVFIATKCGLVWDERKKVRRNLQPASIRREIDASLRRLQTDYIDLYQHHWPDVNTAVKDSLGELFHLQDEGVIRYVGVCNYDLPLLQRCTAAGKIQSLQPPYSMVKRGIEAEILPYCQGQNIGVIAYSPLQAGLLSGAFDRDRLADDDWRRKDEFFIEPKFSQVQKLVAAIRPIAESRGFTVGQLAVAWVLRHPAVTSAIVGARNAVQATANSRAADLELSDQEGQKIHDLIAATAGICSK